MRYFAAHGFYRRAVKALIISPTFDALDTDVRKRLRALHPDAVKDAKRLPREGIPPLPPTLTRKRNSERLQKKDETSAVGPDGISVCHLRMPIRDGKHDRIANDGLKTVLRFPQ